jgi:hypothetical protein
VAQVGESVRYTAQDLVAYRQVGDDTILLPTNSVSMERFGPVRFTNPITLRWRIHE